MHAYLEGNHILGSERHLADRETLKQPANINSKVLSSLSLEQLSILDTSSHFLNSLLQGLQIGVCEVICVTLLVISMPEAFHVLSSLE
jgi:hypothetical protein